MMTERELAERIGLTREVLKKYRPEGEFRDGPAGIELTRAGVDRVLVALGMKDALPLEAQTPRATTQEAKVVLLPRNNRIIVAELNGVRIRVRVKKSANFRRGMSVPVRQIQEPDLYESTRGCPRWPGKW